MHLASFQARVIPITIVGLLGLAASLWVLCTTVPSLHTCGRAVALTGLVLGFFRLFLMIRNLLKGSQVINLPEHPFENRFERFGAPILEELVRFLLITIVFYATGSTTIRSMACIIGIIYALDKQIWLLWLFSPSEYEVRYKKFSRYYDIFIKNETEHNWPKCTYEANLETASFIDSSCFDQLACDVESCEGVDTKSGAASPTSSTTLVSDTNSLNSSALVLLKPEFSFNFGSTSMGKSKLLPIECPQSHLDNNLDYIQRLYTVSPKNTFHLQYENFKLPDRINLDDCSKDLQVVLLNAMELTSESTSSSIHTNDTHFGGGGGGNIEYKFPDGSKLKLGGGAGFDFRRGSKHSKHLVSKGTYQQSQTMSFEHYRWYCWIFCLHKHQIEQKPARQAVNNSIRKKMSSYKLNSESTSLRVCASMNLYNSTDDSFCGEDLESGSHKNVIRNAQMYFRFNRFANRYLDLWNNDLTGNLCLIDPAFSRFGIPLTEISPLYIILYSFSTILWQLLASITFALPFSMKHNMHGTVGSIFITAIFCKLFCVNYTNLQSSRSYKFSILVEFIINLVLFFSIYIFCITESSRL